MSFFPNIALPMIFPPPRATFIASSSDMVIGVTSIRMIRPFLSLVFLQVIEMG